MSKDEFRNLFMSALNAAADAAERRLGHPISRDFDIELHALDSPGHTVTLETALDKLYLAADQLYPLIDVAVKELKPNSTLAFVRVSGRPPVSSFEQTWDPAGTGPFKQIEAVNIIDRRGS